MDKRTIEEEQLRQLKMINANLNPAGAILGRLLKLLWPFVVIPILLSLVAIAVQFAIDPAAFFQSPNRPAVHPAQRAHQHQ